jgi:5-methyltetrahydrofolate--homocysteine methyltransferase
MSYTEEVAAATEAAKGTGLPVVATLTFDTARRSMMGVTPTAFAAFALEIGLDVLGSNCGIGPAELLDSTTELCAVDCGLPIVAKGNCGIPQYINGEIHFHGSPELMAHYALHARDAGATVIGGCCGTTPEHLAAMVDALNSTPPRPFDPEVMTEQLGKPWPDLSSRGVDGGGRRSRRRQG